jgi:hypothetical protein
MLAMLRVSVEHLLQSLQVAWCILYGFFTFHNLQQVSAGRDLDCFLNPGAYKICALTQRLSIYTSILLLMTQALVSRMFVPGISNFVNASVRRWHPRARCGTSQQPHGDGFVICGARSPHAPQVLHSGSNGGMGETSGAEAGDDDERSKRAVMMTPA